jgi:hypothetical protein
VLISRLKNIVGWFVVREKHCSDWKTSWKRRIISRVNMAVVVASVLRQRPVRYTAATLVLRAAAPLFPSHVQCWVCLVPRKGVKKVL